jgi:hypothetical protein
VAKLVVELVVVVVVGEVQSTAVWGSGFADDGRLSLWRDLIPFLRLKPRAKRAEALSRVTSEQRTRTESSFWIKTFIGGAVKTKGRIAEFLIVGAR